ncbi:hypothetical protein K458DRAFT_161679 [Lentithecium fluviatile CBS 122367]|uniref:Jacalin-type lectin domain-containing protein n=1 Tax=Lentithecium fluviatile CBS 122367 TaxID=1168545 RepID=A0A6G1IHG2_9PLEO|nr:hypothetical protein K458DRAFT_161679 [Lentithecium fluviatile CBS 122367]
MRFSLLNQVFLVSLAAFASADDNCDASATEAPFAASQVAGPAFPGGDDPETKCDSKWSTGETIVGIEAWSAKFQVKAVRFKFSQSGWGPIRGSVPNDNVQAHQVKEWDAGAEVGIRLWNNKPDDGDPMDAVGRIIITQGGQDIFEVGGNAKKVDSSEITVDNAGGLILGAKTRSGAWLSSIEFKMLKGKVVRTELVDLVVAEDLTKWNEEQRGIDNVNLADVYYKNTNPVGGPNQTYSFTNTASRDTSKTITSQRTNQWTAGITVTVGGEVGIPFVTKGKIDVATKFEYQRQNMVSISRVHPPPDTFLT